MLGLQPVQARADRVRRCDEVVKLKMGTASVMTLHPREEESMGVSGIPCAQAPGDKGEEICAVSMRMMARMDSGGGSRPERSRSLAC